MVGGCWSFCPVFLKVLRIKCCRDAGPVVPCEQFSSSGSGVLTHPHSFQQNGALLVVQKFGVGMIPGSDLDFSCSVSDDHNEQQFWFSVHYFFFLADEAQDACHVDNAS